MTNLIAALEVENIATLKALAMGGTVILFSAYCVVAMVADYVITKFKNRRK